MQHHNPDISLDDHQSPMPKPFQNRIPHYWTPRAIKQINLLLRPPKISLLLNFTLLQFAISESFLIKTLPLPTTSPSYLKPATRTFAISVDYAQYLIIRPHAQIATSIVHSKLDYCNSLFYSINSSQIKRLQTIQNALARAVTKTPKHHHITPVLKSLHWLKIPQRIHYKIASLTYNTLQTSQPS